MSTTKWPEFLQNSEMIGIQEQMQKQMEEVMTKIVEHQDSYFINKLAAIGFIPPLQYQYLLVYPNKLGEEELADLRTLKRRKTGEHFLGWIVFGRGRSIEFYDITGKRKFNPDDVYITITNNKES